MIDWHTALDDFLLDLVSLIAEQLELAKKDPSDQCAAVEVAIGAISVIKRRLREDEHETATRVVVLQPHVSRATLTRLQARMGR